MGRPIRPQDVVLNRYDVIVIGATEWGMTAAVAAARRGKRVLLVSDSDRIGGMSTGGMNLGDLEANKSPFMVAGLARRFWSEVAVLSSEQKVFERWHRQNGRTKPSWNQAVVDKWVSAEKNITVLLSSNIESVSLSGTRIVSAVISGVTYWARVWIDASATGDVVQKAQLSRSIGRESSSQYSETHAGVMAPVAWTGGGTDIDPYVTPGNAASGLLFGIDSTSVESAGTGDGRVMGFGYRLYLTSVVGEKTAFPSPDMAHYDPAKYELLGRAFASAPSYFGDASAGLTRLFQFYDITPGGSTSAAMGPTYIPYVDLNNTGAVSTNYPVAAECLEYVTATPARRAEIAESAKQWILGLFYWLLNSGDSRIPSGIVTALGAYGFSNKEFLRYGGFSPQFYVREGCRVIGDFVLTEPNCTVQSGYVDPIAWGYFPFDCHPVRRVVQSGAAKIEGTLFAALPASQVGFPVPYRTLLPKVAECTNLLCPGAPSVSWVAWTSVRLVPVLMAMGEAAGIAASMAIEQDINVQAVSSSRLIAEQNLFELRDGVVIGTNGSGIWPTSSQGTITQTGGAWTATTNRWLWLGASHLTVPAATAKQLKFAPNLFTDGMYRVMVLYPPADSVANGDLGRATNLPVKIVHGDGTTTRTINQQYPGGNGGFWEDMGVYWFARGQPSAHYVEFDATSADGIVAVAGVKFVPVKS